jgi:hypothetical protein
MAVKIYFKMMDHVAMGFAGALPILRGGGMTLEMILGFTWFGLVAWGG